MVSNAVSGAGYLLQGMRLIARPKLRQFVLIPLLINILVFSGAIYLGVAQFEHFVAFLDSQMPSWLSWLEWVLWPLFVLLLLIVVFYGFGMVANLIAAPFNSLLAEKVEAILIGRSVEQSSDYARMLADLLPTLRDEIWKVLYALLWSLPFLALLLVPVAGPVLWFFFSAWILTVQYSDYPMGNHGLTFREMRRRLRERRAVTLGFGSAAVCLGMIPVVNFILMPSAVAGATLMWVREFRDGSSYQGPHESRVATRYVLLLIDHLSGEMTGRILEGPLAGRALEQTSTEELLGLLRTCYLADAESAEALEVYLSRERGQTIEETPHPRPEAARRDPGSVQMGADEARAVLGVGPQATPEDVRAAHRRLIQRLHPDRGGSDYLAAKVNEAKRILIG